MNAEDKAKEREQYRRMVAVIINNDPDMKRRVDKNARDQIKSIRDAMPDATDETVILFMLSMATFVARIMTLPLSEVDAAMHSVFDNNMTAAAHVAGAYDVDNPDDLPHWDGKTATARFPFTMSGPAGHHCEHHDHSPDDGDTTIDDIIGRQYL